MDLPAALTKVSAEVVLCGHHDPTAVFCQPSATEVEERTTQLLTLTAAARNFVISSGCDLPASAKLENLDAFYKAVSKSSSSAAV